ncbi:MAG: archaellin/type IV pilin N-terminal domain-containing protein [archaeon]
MNIFPFGRSKKAISPIIAVILLLMMTVAVAGAAFFWLSRIQGQMQGGVESYQSKIFENIASRVDVIDADYQTISSVEYLTIFLHNTGNSKIPVSSAASFPTTTWILKDSDQVAVCSTNWGGGTNQTACTEGCGSTTQIDVGEIHKVVLRLSGTTCALSLKSSGTVFSFTIDFSGKTTTSGSFVK